MKHFFSVIFAAVCLMMMTMLCNFVNTMSFRLTAHQTALPSQYLCSFWLRLTNIEAILKVFLMRFCAKHGGGRQHCCISICRETESETNRLVWDTCSSPPAAVHFAKQPEVDLVKQQRLCVEQLLAVDRAHTCADARCFFLLQFKQPTHQSLLSMGTSGSNLSHLERLKFCEFCELLGCSAQ